MRRTQRRIALLLCAALVLALAFSAVFMAVEAGHTCTDRHCAICRTLTFCSSFLKTLRAAHGTQAAVAAAAFCAFFAAAYGAIFTGAQTLISLKVKLSI